MKIFIIISVLLLSGCAAVQKPINDPAGLGWGYIERIDYNGITQG